MPWLFFNLAALSITALYFVYRKARDVLTAHHREMRQRVAFMLWTASQQPR